MKIQKTIFALILLLSNSQAFAHCPAIYKAELACMWLNNNLLYFYDHKLEHNGPYKDLKNSELTSIKNTNGSVITFKKLARGIYKLETAEHLKTVTVVFTADKNKTEIKVNHD